MHNCDICIEEKEKFHKCRCIYLVCVDCVSQLPTRSCPFCRRYYPGKNNNETLIHIMLDYADLDVIVRKNLVGLLKSKDETL